MSDMRWLERRALGFYCVKAVPRPLWEAVGKRRLVESLKTRDLRCAQARRHRVLAKFDEQIERAAAQHRATAGRDPRVETGLAWRETFAAIARGDKHVVARFRGHPIENPHTGDVISDPIEIAREVAEMVFFDTVGEMNAKDAEVMAPIALGKATPLMAYVDAWIAEGGARGPVRARTAQQYRTDLASFAAWLAAENIPVTIEAVTKSVAGRYASHFVKAGGERKTANRKISAVSAYWRWLIKRTERETNPWTGQSLSKARRPGEAKAKRGYLDAELLALLRGDPGEELADAIRIGALTGARLEEIYRLRIADCRGGWFSIREGKTAAAVRRVPIHADLSPIIDRRCQGKPDGAYLLHEAGGDPKPGRERSMPASKRFGRYRKAVGVDERPEGRRSSRVDFHSLRRWFTTTARNKGVDLATVQAIIGHDTGNLADDVYSDGPDDGLLRRAVEVVRLPVAEAEAPGAPAD
jgi:integrase